MAQRPPPRPCPKLAFLGEEIKSSSKGKERPDLHETQRAKQAAFLATSWAADF